ncbi:MAG: hypothetical protein QOD00_499 [Blastocatellia bacterium]|jgi:hypothetical protein|nr:hypothetical protein [Blastocatellia bacterium]
MTDILTELCESEILAQKAKQVPEWFARPYQLVSLLEMEQFYAAFFISKLLFFHEIFTESIKGESPNQPISQATRELMEKRLVALSEECKKAGLENSVSHLMSLRISVAMGEYNYGSLKYVGEEVERVISLELIKSSFFWIPKDDADYFQKDDLFGVKEKFPEANKEIVEAGNCYATGSYTACVFHLMRAVEVGSRKLVSALNAGKYLDPPNRPVELCTWDDLLKALDKGVADKAVGTRNDAAKKATYEFYHHAVAQFRNFKDAWRNNVSHKRETYKQGKAKDIMDNTRQFMQHLASRLGEKKRAK